VLTLPAWGLRNDEAAVEGAVDTVVAGAAITHADPLVADVALGVAGVAVVAREGVVDLLAAARGAAGLVCARVGVVAVRDGDAGLRAAAAGLTQLAEGALAVIVGVDALEIPTPVVGTGMAVVAVRKNRALYTATRRVVPGETFPSLWAERVIRLAVAVPVSAGAAVDLARIGIFAVGIDSAFGGQTALMGGTELTLGADRVVHLPQALPGRRVTVIHGAALAVGAIAVDRALPGYASPF